MRIIGEDAFPGSYKASEAALKKAVSGLPNVGEHSLLCRLQTLFPLHHWVVSGFSLFLAAAPTQVASSNVGFISRYFWQQPQPKWPHQIWGLLRQ